MAQPSTERTNFGWGDLKTEFDRLVSLHQELKEEEDRVKAKKENLRNKIVKMNESRRARVLALLRENKRAICLVHSLVFRESDTCETIVPEEGTIVVQVNKSWTESHRYYDGDKTYSQHSRVYGTTACKLCQAVLSHGSVSDLNHSEHIMMRDQKPSTNLVLEYFYSPSIIDEVSEYFGMPPITFESLKS